MIVVRRAIRENISTIVDFQQKMALETESLNLKTSVVSNGVSFIFDHPENGFYLIATENDIVIGSLLLTPEWSDWRNSMWLWIQSLYVLPEHREKGVFKMLYTHVKELVSNSDKYAGIKLYVDQDNVSAQDVYNKMGMGLSHYRMYEWEK